MTKSPISTAIPVIVVMGTQTNIEHVSVQEQLVKPFEGNELIATNRHGGRGIEAVVVSTGEEIDTGRRRFSRSANRSLVYRVE